MLKNTNVFLPGNFKFLFFSATVEIYFWKFITNVSFVNVEISTFLEY